MGPTDTKFNLIEVKSEAGRNYFIEGFVSTTDPDLYNDIVTEEAQKVILRQLLNQDITMDDNHDVWVNPSTGEKYDRPQNKIPVAKVEKAELRELEDGSVGTFVRVKLNNNYPKFKETLGSIKDGFLHSFSIAYNVTKQSMKKMGDTTFRVIDDLNIFNVGITGVPVNNNATFQLALKSINNKMAEEIQTEELQTKVDTLSQENTELKSQIETKDAELKSQSEKLEALEVATSDENVELKSVSDAQEKELIELKSKFDKIDAIEKEVTELKSVFEKVRATPMNGAELKSQSNNATVAAGVIDFKELLPQQ